MKLFLDTNIIVDFLTERDGFYDLAAQVVNLADSGEAELCCSALSYATVFYLVRPTKGKETTLKMLREFSKICEVAPVDSSIVDAALYSSFKDFEDAIQYFCALNAGADIIITRNIKDFKEATLPVKMPVDLFE